jgi:hypothetical protein
LSQACCILAGLLLPSLGYIFYALLLWGVYLAFWWKCGGIASAAVMAVLPVMGLCGWSTQLVFMVGLKWLLIGRFKEVWQEIAEACCKPGFCCPLFTLCFMVVQSRG